MAGLIDAELISLDSMALYRGMDVGTAKPTPEQRARVPHHLLDVIEPQEEYSVAQYVEAAEQCVKEIQGRGRQPLFVGGTPLYLKALLRGLFDGPPADPELRERLQEEARRLGSDALHRRLAKVDPAAAQRLHPNDTRRLIRALEVFEKTGRPISEFQRQFDTGLAAEQCRAFVLDWPRAELHVRIDRRVERMFAGGLVEEVRGLLAAGRPLSKTARQAVGYRETLEHLEGLRGLEETVKLVQTRTRQLARRQETWFRSLSECRFVPLTGEVDPLVIAGQIRAAGEGGLPDFPARAAGNRRQ